MKKYFISFYFILWAIVGFAQITPSGEKPYIRVSTPRVPIAVETDLDDYTKAINTIQYLDGLGRPMQSVGYRTSPNAQDLLMGTNTLDQVGRVKRSYLPVQGNLSNGSYQTNATTLAETFYVDTAPYNEVETYEASPFSRPLKTVGAGQAFRTGISKGSTEHIYTAGAGIRKYIVNEDVNGNVTSVNGSLSFSDGDLLMRVQADEANNSTKEFIDKEGRTIETWQISTTGSILKTAYIYDDVSRLRYIIPPKAYDLANTFDETTLPNTNYFNEGVYAFRYDERGRVVEKHTPSGGWHYTVYNELDQALLSQNPRQRETNLWEWVRYDGHGRLVMGGTWTNGGNSISRANLQTAFLNFLADTQFEERSTASGNLYGYTSRSFPSSITIVASDVKRVYYFDDYTWVNTVGVPNTALGFSQYKTQQWGNPKGLATGSLVRKLDSGVMLKSVMYYDDKNRLIQSQTENRFGGVNQSDLVLNFAGDLLEERTIYRKPSKADIITSTKYTYDHVGRKTGAIHFLNGKPTPLAQYKHDGIGRVIQKRLMQAGSDFIIEGSPQPNGDQDIANRFVLLTTGTITAENGTYLACISPNMLQEIDYSYNVRGQLRGINLDASGDLALTNGDVFGMKLDYHETGVFFDGKLHKQTWKSTSQATNRGFTYGYDDFKRIQEATYAGVGNENYNLSGMAYDANGNITALQRNGLTGSNSWGAIDNLGYAYDTGNILQGIQDYTSNVKGFKDNGNQSDYTYYSDGSLKTDANKGITNIIYNYLDLPERIEFGTSQRIENIYDAEGIKLSQKVVNGSVTITTDYMGGLIYRNDSLKTIMHDEGRIFFDATQNSHYQFFIADHLGNTRIIIERINASTALVQENHYGAWGELLEGIGTELNESSWKFLFQGKSYIDDFGLNLYDFESRLNDPIIGRMWQVDGADQFASGYTSMGNQPTMRIDPDGQFAPIVFVGAALIGGGSNLWSNWSKIKGWKQGLAYFASGAAGGALSVINPALGGSVTAGSNFLIDVATGNVPNFKNSQNPAWDVAKYAGGLALDGFGAAGSGGIARFGYSKLSSFFSSEAISTTSGALGFAKTGSEVGSFALESTAEIITKPAIKGIGNTLASQGIKQVAKNLNTNVAKGNFGIYEIFKDGQLYKYGKADLGRITQSSGRPTRLHQQLRKLRDLYPNSEITGDVIDNLGKVTTNTAKGAENAYLNFYYKTTGIIPEGNLKSFFPR